MIAGRLNVALMRAHWPEFLRIAASIRTGTVAASLIMRQLTAHPRQNGVAMALRELGRLERSLFMLDWISTPTLRRDTGRELNKGEARNSLARRGHHTICSKSYANGPCISRLPFGTIFKEGFERKKPTPGRAAPEPCINGRL